MLLPAKGKKNEKPNHLRFIYIIRDHGLGKKGSFFLFFTPEKEMPLSRPMQSSHVSSISYIINIGMKSIHVTHHDISLPMKMRKRKIFISSIFFLHFFGMRYTQHRAVSTLVCPLSLLLRALSIEIFI